MLDNLLYNLPFLTALFWLITVGFCRQPINALSRWALILYLADSLLLNYAYTCMMHDACNVYTIKLLHTFSLTSILPFYYLYFYLTTHGPKISWRIQLLFIPSIVLTAITGFVMAGMTPEELQIVARYPEFSHPDLLNSHSTEILKHLQLAAALTLLGEVIIIASASIVTLYKYKRSVVNFYTETHDKLFGITVEVLVVMLIALFSSIALVTTNKEYFARGEVLAITSFVSALPMFIIGIHYLRRRFTVQDLVKDELEHELNTPTPDAPLDETDKQSVEVNIVYIAERIVDLVETKQYYLKPDLRITDVCDLLSTNRTYISQAINNHLGGNFSDYINRHRVEHAKQLLSGRSNDNFTIEALAVQSGFATAASMNRAFRKAVGMTPHQFRQNSLLVK